MKLLSYTGTRPGISGVGNRLVRLRLSSRYSHSEVMFEPGDGCEQYMPDGSLEPDANGAYWCASSSASDRMPDWGGVRNRRAGKMGGVRFKRVVVKPDNWNVKNYPFSPDEVASFFVRMEGLPYDWRHILSFLGVIPNLVIGQDQWEYTCAEICAAAAGFIHAEIFDPHNLAVVVGRLNALLEEGYTPLAAES